MKVQPYVEFTTQRGVRMIARYVPISGRYGLGGRLTNYDKPMVDFYDTRYEHENWMGFKGQFITRYDTSTLRGHTGGLCLDGGTPIWDVDGNSMSFVMGWLAGIESVLLSHSLEEE